MLQHPSDQTNAERNQTESEAEHIGSVRVDEVNLLLLVKQHLEVTLLLLGHQNRIHNSDVKDCTNWFPLYLYHNPSVLTLGLYHGQKVVVSHTTNLTHIEQ